ncbi:MBL fold metallo-hydrolase RNA specificity domain-containing protein [Vibrio genomosp. F10]|uniref:MBL fold metallo-hydrolase RNA specificity domain-containing protein n=1 Tax=Vibrio genomosp. F10 TaxID=723171 RepID=UPI00031DBEFC|nr:MBL fold metallo-hydrolase [Vibrio genomosp. F10]OEF04895.1 MBL fold hydrolase [Vibrio genomosp. F10 str. 9ZB36]
MALIGEWIMEIIHHGGKNTITGSCHELRANEQSILIDCGLFQGADTRPLDIEFATQHLDALLLTHSHIDHIGRLPWLLATQFSKPIYCSDATAELVPLMLEDSLKLQLGLTQKKTEQVLNHLRRMLSPRKYNQWFPITKENPNGLMARFQQAGHILGSAYIEVRLPNQEVIVFSGDLGPNNTPLLPDPVSPQRADHLLIETTYGNATHEDISTRSERLKAIIDRSLSDGGAILIPAFSVGRTQELLFDIERLIYTHQIDIKVPIILDSPMAQKVTDSYRRFKQLWGQEAKERLQTHRHPLAFEQCITVEDYRSHQRLVNRLQSTGEPAIVVAASGMCQGGRIMDYLKALLPDKRTDVILAGYQAKGTLGSDIQNNKRSVLIDDEAITVNARVHSMSGYSAHADKADLLKFIEGISPPPKTVHLIHGEPKAKEQFSSELIKKGLTVIK